MLGGPYREEIMFIGDKNTEGKRARRGHWGWEELLVPLPEMTLKNKVVRQKRGRKKKVWVNVPQ